MENLSILQGGQLNSTQEIEILCMLFDRALSIFSMTSIKKHMDYFNFRSKIQLYHPVLEFLSLYRMRRKGPKGRHEQRGAKISH